MAHLTCVGGKLGGGERAAQSIFEYSVPASIFPVRRTTSRSATCTGGSRCPRPPRCTTAARRSPSTSASRTTRAWSAWSRRRPASRPGSPTSRSPPGGGCAPCAARSPSSRRRPAALARTTCGSTCASRPAPGCATTPIAILPNALEVRIDPEFAARRPGARVPRPRRRAAHHADTGAAVRRVLRHAGRSATRGSPPCSGSCTTRSPPPTVPPTGRRQGRAVAGR